jgi:S-adenosylmethionine:tRNA ribosyltransferase-isomerase
MTLAEFDFPFDPSLVADRPVEPRDRARLLVLPRRGNAPAHQVVTDLPHLLYPGDLLIVNDTKVMPVRLIGRKHPTGGKVDLLLVRDLGDGTWEAMLKGGSRPGLMIKLGVEATATVVDSDSKRTTVRIESATPMHELLQTIGQMPLPPYIKRRPVAEDREWYQTVFARAEGAIAAPTAGLHFTEGLLSALHRRGIGLATVTLHVGPGTFLPVTSKRIDAHRMMPERFEVTPETVAMVERTKAAGRRVVAVGTTVVRALEAAGGPDGTLQAQRGETALFITPGYTFRVVDGLMTNFHLPKTTLIMLVSAFAGTERLRAAYEEAIKERYRFYSYGDAMLIV